MDSVDADASVADTTISQLTWIYDALERLRYRVSDGDRFPIRHGLAILQQRARRQQAVFYAATHVDAWIEMEG